MLILSAGGTDYNCGLAPFFEGPNPEVTDENPQKRLIVTGTPLWSHCAAMRV